MKRTKVIWLGLGLTHVGLVFAGAFQVPVGKGALRELTSRYGQISGSTSGYGFFAPGVDSQLRATFVAYDSAGKELARVPLERGISHEADLRVGNIIGWFWRNQPDIKTKRALTASWAGKIFARYPGAAAVEVLLDEYHLPDMASYRQGQRPHWMKHYKAKFTRRTDDAAGKAQG